MSKRIKRVFSNGSQVIHLWANEVQSDARSKNVFFEGDSVYSYGYHYKLGQIHKVNGIKIALVNSRRYSNTTAKHQSWASSAVNHMLKLRSSDVARIDIAIKETQESIVSQLMGHFSQRRFWTGYKIKRSDFNNIDNFNKICDLVKVKHLKIDLTDDFIKLMNAHVKLCLKKQSVKDKIKELARIEGNKIRIERDKIHAAQAQVDLTAWLHAQGPLTGPMHRINPQLIRINKTTRMVETTMGAEVPLDEALTMLARIQKGLAKQGDKIGGFTLEEVKGSIVKIGCHKIDFKEASVILKQAA